MIARFGHHRDITEADRAAFIGDWISVCSDEARHFGLLQTRLTQLDMSYGDMPAHNGLWEASLKTKDNFAARLAIAPMVLEAKVKRPRILLPLIGTKLLCWTTKAPV